MTGPLASAHVRAELDWGRLDAEAAARARAMAVAAERAFSRQLRNKLSLTPEVSVAQAQAAGRRAARVASIAFGAEMRSNPPLIRVGVDTTQISAAAARAAREAGRAFNASDKPILQAVINVDPARARWVGKRAAALVKAAFDAEMRRNPLHVRPVVDLTRANRAGRDAARSAREGFNGEMRSRPLDLGRWLGAGRGGAGGGLGNMTRQMTGLVGAGRGLRAAGIAALIAAIGGAAGAAAGAVGGLVAGIAAIGPAAAAGLSTALVGFSGLFTAFQESGSAAAGAAAQDTTRQVAQATRSLRDANEGVADAIKGVTRAEKDVQRAKRESRQAEVELTRARKDAAEQIEDLNLALRGSAISEKDAALSLREAQMDLRTLDTSDMSGEEAAIARERAILRVASAEQSLLENQESNRDLAAEAIEANTRGVEGSEQVVAARQRLADANDAVVDSEDNLADAHRGVRNAQEAVEDATLALQDAMNGAAGTTDAFAEAMAKLSPNAQAFVLAMRELGPMWTDLRMATQDTMFQDLDQVMTGLATTTLPTLKTGMVDVAGSMNSAARDFAAFWSSASSQEGLRAAFAGTADMITGMQPGLAAATEGFLSMGRAVEPIADEIGASLGGLLGQMGEAFTAAFEDGSLTEAMGNFADMFDGLGGGLGALVTGLIDFANVAGPVVGPLLQSLGEGIRDLAPGLGAFGAAFGEGLIDLMPMLVDFINALSVGLIPVMPVLVQLLGALGTVLTPLIPPLSEVLQVLGGALAEALVALEPAIGPLGEAFAAVVAAIAPLLPGIAAIAAQLVTMAAPAVVMFANAVGGLTEPLGAVLQFIGENRDVLLTLIAIIAGAYAVFQTLTVVLTVFTAVMRTITIITRAWAVVQGVLNAVMAANPIALIVLAVAALVAALVLAYNHSETFRNIVQAAWEGIQQAVSWAWENAIKPVLGFLMDLLSAVGQAITWMWQNAWKPALEGIGAIAMWLWENAIQPVFGWIGDRIAEAGLGATILWQGYFGPAFSGIGSAAVWLWENAIQPVFGWIGGRISELGEVITFLWKNAWEPALRGIGDVASWAWENAIKPAFGWIKDAVSSIGDAFSNMGTVVASVWDKVVIAVKKSVGELGRVLQTIQIPEGIPIVGGWGTKPLGDRLVAWASPYRDGGLAQGPGTGTSDSILARLSNGEFVMPEAVTRRILPILEAFREGKDPVRVLFEALPGFVNGGLVSAAQINKFPRENGLEGDPYVWGGVRWGDCSGAMSALARFAVGMDPFGGRFATGNMREALTSMGFEPGVGPPGSLSFGWFNGGPYGGHTAGTLPDGTNVEMGGARGDGQVGGGAAGAGDPSFTDHAHLPPEFFIGGDEMPGQPSSAAASVGPTQSSTAGMGITSSGFGGPGGSGTSGAAAQAAMGSGTYSSAYSSATGGGGGGNGRYGSGIFGLDAGIAWAADQNFGSQAEEWGKNAIKEIGGQFLSDIGLDGLFGKAVDTAYDALLKQAEEQRASGDGVTFNNTFIGMDEQKAAEEQRRQFEQRMTPVGVTYRQGG